MSHARPAALIAMQPEVFALQFDPHRLGRLEQLVDLLLPGIADLDDAATAGVLGRVEVLVTSWGAPALTADRLDRMPALRAVFHAAGTVRPLTTDAFWHRGIRITSAADANAIPVAEFTFASIVLAGKRAQFLAREPRAHLGDRGGRFDPGSSSNLGRRIGIVGFSRIGRRVATLLRQLDEVEVLVADPYADPDEVARTGARLVELDDLLRRVDVLSLHAPELPATRGMIGARELALLRDGATLVNTARGSLVDTDALAAECIAGRLDAVLDVTDPEPLPADSPLLALPNVSLTPHIAGSLGTETRRMADSAIGELERFTLGLPLEHEVRVEDLGVLA
ncbi:hydroxyacid dehydrogenase [Agromyces sp. CFH 90414]|uniref:Hydroxyacid dehydrogenase n=1 Tax=Agromyces agglutinans TaxID=2662258 RepID=A0A6I2FA54_9MICO|nr:hydroxyacid dehydrogenase [Agromyces agglutinans]MRG61221.1 hydroxyacid dehydrogenase [Agromyces agglutinans]